MFNPFKKVKEVAQTMVASTKSEQAIIDEIHNEFDSSTERLLKEAKAILEQDVNTAKGEELAKLGFRMSKSTLEAKEVIATKQEKEKIANHIQYYRQHYPFNKFITEQEVEKICKKYGLLCGDVEYYTGDVPDNNLKEISSFKLMEQDCTKYKCDFYKSESSGHGWRYFLPSRNKEGRYGYVKNTRWGNELYSVENHEQEYHYEKPEFRICASVKDFDMTQMRVTDGYKLDKNIPDPVVLQPVNGGYLIISKWGIEGQDETLVNEKLN